MNQEDLALDLILLYGMNEMEAKAFKIACVYLEKSRKMFPNYNHNRMPKGDPRKSELFKYCYKLLRETQGKIADSDYKLYVHAQLDCMRSIKIGELHPLITPACLAGKNAWKRWLLWKSRYDKWVESRASASITEKINIHTPEKIKKDLWRTKQFLIAWFDRLSPEDIKTALKDQSIFQWHQTGSVCGYYLAISPLVQNWLAKNPLDLMKEYNINMSIYEIARQPEIVQYFETEFPDEKGSTL